MLTSRGQSSSFPTPSSEIQQHRQVACSSAPSGKPTGPRQPQAGIKARSSYTSRSRHNSRKQRRQDLTTRGERLEFLLKRVGRLEEGLLDAQLKDAQFDDDVKQLKEDFKSLLERKGYVLEALAWPGFESMGVSGDLQTRADILRMVFPEPPKSAMDTAPKLKDAINSAVAQPLEADDLGFRKAVQVPLEHEGMHEEVKAIHKLTKVDSEVK